MNKLPDSKSATVNLKDKIVQKIDTTAAACKQVEDETAATSEHAEGHNEATAAADKGRNEATAAAAAKKRSDSRDILWSQNNMARVKKMKKSWLPSM